ncbi:hypothetical protein [Methanohalophilus sp. DAL1]|uniref:hypothetical protein n=1 Tax=Methanohalophilus sp. DAL1 TaxID=1864608 RepID=UPI000817404D|nr:hypothetical protein [Methanohalophilus sp. DAL1]OBZ35243.1 MAG: hypothetical protein A9957_08290 [Methanohalophilus sp. DAL1]
MGQRGIGCAVLINRVDPGHGLQVLQCAGSMAGGIMIVLKNSGSLSSTIGINISIDMSTDGNGGLMDGNEG